MGALSILGFASSAAVTSVTLPCLRQGRIDESDKGVSVMKKVLLTSLFVPIVLATATAFYTKSIPILALDDKDRPATFNERWDALKEVN
jgi:hypothetical protein